MLYLTRKIGEGIVINDDIELEVIEIKGKTVKIGFNCPRSASILRKELLTKIASENTAALNSSQMFTDYFSKGTPHAEKN